ncbi:hypothetical protein BC828DRAFT_58591 [Blastocladiella britannica]|nr:hypothetical protein BC828DRAFT_58591 [Blastocladiella britannica]
MHFISGDVARVHLSDSAAALVGKFVQKQGPEIHAALVPSIAANLLENDPDASPPIRNSAGEEVDFAIHALTVLGHNSNTSAVKKGNKVLEQALSAILVLVDTVEPSLPQLVLASTVIDFSLYLPFEAWKLAMDRVGLTLEKHMRAVNFLLVRDSSALYHSFAFMERRD